MSDAEYMFCQSTDANVNQSYLIFTSLMKECQQQTQDPTLSSQLRDVLTSFPREERRNLVNHETVAKVSPLLAACRRGHLKIVSFLVEVCDADIEQKGVYNSTDDSSSHVVTPLWCAAVMGHIEVVNFLIQKGADVNKASDTGSTPCRSACFMNNVAIVHLLVENGADVNKQNINGGTCLINSIQNTALCEYLIKHGADVNAADIQHKSALHYAILEDRYKTCVLLIENGANVHAKARDFADALQLAAIKATTRIFDYLIDNADYPPEYVCNSYELLGSTLIEQYNDHHNALEAWTIAIQNRDSDSIPKLPQMKPQRAFQNLVEFQSRTELMRIANDIEMLQMQSLLVCERVLGPGHKESLLRLALRGLSFSKMNQHQRAIDLWTRSLEIRVEEDASILCSEVACTAQLLVKLYEEKISVLMSDHDQFDDILYILSLLVNKVPDAMRLTSIKPVFMIQIDCLDKIMKSITHLIFFVLELANTEAKLQRAEDLISNFLQNKPRSPINDNTILHLSVSKSNKLKDVFIEPVTFPNVKMINFLLKCGANPNALNSKHSTPLHVATFSNNFDNKVVSALLDHGAHIDTPNNVGSIPAYTIASYGENTVCITNYLTLQCLAARIIKRQKIEYHNLVPTSVEEFLNIH